MHGIDSFNKEFIQGFLFTPDTLAFVHFKRAIYFEWVVETGRSLVNRQC